MNAGNVVAFLVTFSMFATFFFITLYMQNVEGLSPLQTGVRFLPMTILIIGTAPVAGKLSDRFGSRGLLTLGTALCLLALLRRGSAHGRWLLLAGVPWVGYVIAELIAGGRLGS